MKFTLNFIFDVLHGPEKFEVVLIAWGAALFQTWIVVEPSEVLALTLVPNIAEHPLIAKCKYHLKELGFI